MSDYIFLIPLLPLAGAMVNGLLGKRLPLGVVYALACGSVLGSFLLSLAGLASLLSMEEPAQRVIIQTLYRWVAVVWDGGELSLDMAFRLDPLSLIMCLVVSGVGFLIHLYSVGYMSGDPSQPRYFSYLNLFTFSMLVLVLADNLLLMFVGWEGVGLCSYLLIGFWFSDIEKARAGMKAFMVNRVGDFGFFIGLMLLFWTLHGTQGAWSGLSITGLEQAMPQLVAASPIWGVGVATWVALLFFVGATGKSAQIPLYIWLPDAMAGPTPVSALIHAATMVTAGVFMIARLNFLYLAAPVAMAVVAVVGVLTALLAALIALGQDDIKKVLAYSTISQLGYMFLAVGSAAFSAGVFHLITHAFFKALLFLGAGSVIHAVGRNDMRKMGGLRRYMPTTFATLLVGYLAICSLPPMSGFFSKDEILWAAMTAHMPWPGLGIALGVLGLVVAGLTALYMTRLMVLTFAGPFRGGPGEEEHLHESPRVMTIPLIILAVLSALGGLLGLPELSGAPHLLKEFLGPVFPSGTGAGLHGDVLAKELLLAASSIAVSLGGMYLGWRMFISRPEARRAFKERFAPLVKAATGKFYVDEFYQAVFVAPFLWLVRASGQFDLRAIDRQVDRSAAMTTKLSALVGWEDLKLLDGLINYLAEMVKRWGAAMRRLQTGRVRHYLYSAVLGVFLLYLLNLGM